MVLFKVTQVKVNEMLERCSKILIILVMLWMISIVTIIKQYKRPQTVFLSPMMAFNMHLNEIERKHLNDNESDFDAWLLMKPTFGDINLESKYTAVKGDEFPPGIKGRPVYLNHDLKNPLREIVRKGWVIHAFNEFVSSIIPLNRTLFDVRDPWCRQRNYSSILPQASVIICFHNEAWSTLLRTVYSVLNRSPKQLIKEIILFDDYSSMSHLQKSLEDFIRSLPKVTLVRSTRREGLIRARLLALKYVTAPVVIFLDSHCECTEGWLEPLLDRIAENTTRVVSPVVDIIHSNSFEYIPQDLNDLHVGGFNWDLRFVWQSIPREVLVKRKHAAEPIKTPTISGGLFAINKKFFEKIGYYDDGFEFWGAENLELSFKTWMCGGSLEIVPCSHVGHVFRKRFPYPKQPGAIRKNCIRLAEVWMDDYAKYYYERIGNSKGEFGDVTQRKYIREQLNCKSFAWYLKEITPEIEVPNNYVSSGKIYGMSGDLLCLDASVSFQEYHEGVRLLPCHFQGGNQFWVYTKDGEIKRDEFCLDDVSDGIVLSLCKGRKLSQIWLYNEHTYTITNMNSLQCLRAAQHNGEWTIVMDKCSDNHRQTWKMENYKVERLSSELKILAKRYVK